MWVRRRSRRSKQKRRDRKSGRLAQTMLRASFIVEGIGVGVWRAQRTCPPNENILRSLGNIPMLGSKSNGTHPRTLARSRKVI